MTNPIDIISGLAHKLVDMANEYWLYAAAGFVIITVIIIFKVIF